MKSLAIKEARTFPQTYGHSSHSSPRVLAPLTEGLKPTSSVCFAGAGWFPWRNQPLGDMRRGWWVSPETPAPFGVLLTQDLLLALALLLRSQVAVLLLQEPHRRPAMLLKVPLVFCKRRRKAYIQLEATCSFTCFKIYCFTYKGLSLNFFPFLLSYTEPLPL